MIKIVVADNQELTRRGVASMLQALKPEADLVFATSVLHLQTILANELPELLIFDYTEFECESVRDFCKLFAVAPNVKLLSISESKIREDLLYLKNTGVNGFLLKSCNFSEFSEALHAALDMRKYYGEEILELLIDSNAGAKQIDKVRFTQAETEIVRFIAQGLTTKEIAARKCLSHHTIITHRKNIFRKAGITSTSELIMYAIRSGIVDTLEYYI